MIGTIKADNAAARYETLTAQRTFFLEDARANARLTIPHICRPEGYQGEDARRHTVGSEGVSHLASKFTLGLFPPGASFFRLEPDKLKLRMAENEMRAMAAEAGQELPEE